MKCSFLGGWDFLSIHYVAFAFESLPETMFTWQQLQTADNMQQTLRQKPSLSRTENARSGSTPEAKT